MIDSKSASAIGLIFGLALWVTSLLWFSMVTEETSAFNAITILILGLTLMSVGLTIAIISAIWLFFIKE